MDKLRQLIKSNLFTMRTNFFAGMGGLTLYPYIHLTTPINIGPYTAVCYSVHHLHIISLLNNIAIMESREVGFQKKKYINYYPISNNYSFDEKIKSIYFVNVNKNTSNKSRSFWYTDTIKQSSFSPDCQKAINEIVQHRDMITKTAIGMSMVNAIVQYNFLQHVHHDVIFSTGISFGILYSITAMINFKNNIEIVANEVPIKKKYFYINTFGDVVPTNYMFGIYMRYKSNKL